MNNKAHLGSGPKYFDINLPINNAPPPDRSKKEFSNWQSQTPEQRLKNAYLLVDDMFDFFDEQKWPNIKSLLDTISANPKLHHHLAFRMPATVPTSSYNCYPDNRLTLMHVLARRELPPTIEGQEMYKYTIKALIKCGLSPLEKCNEDGFSALATLLTNRTSSVEMLEFFASLHPDSFTSLDEENTPLVNILVLSMRYKKAFDWGISAIPLDLIEENIKAFEKRMTNESLSKKYGAYKHRLLARLERATLEKAIDVKSPAYPVTSSSKL